MHAAQEYTNTNTRTIHEYYNGKQLVQHAKPSGEPPSKNTIKTNLISKDINLTRINIIF